MVVFGPNEAGYGVQSVVWSGTATNGNCTKQLPQGQGSVARLPLTIVSLGTITITANITYQMQSNGKTPPPTTASGTFSVVAPTAQMVNYNAGAAYGLAQQAAIQWQLMFTDFDAGGYNFGPEEQISYIVPANTPPPFNGGWGYGQNTPLLLLSPGGLLTDVKGPNPAGGGFAQQPAGTIILQYTQILGIYYTDFCGNKQDIILGTYTVTYQMANDGSATWNCTVTAQ